MDKLFDLSDYEDHPIAEDEEKHVKNENKDVDQSYTSSDSSSSSSSSEEEEQSLDKVFPKNKSQSTKDNTQQQLAKTSQKSLGNKEGDKPTNKKNDDKSKDKKEKTTDKKRIGKGSQKNYAVDDSIEISKFNKIPSLALKFPFELDDFQKRSIIRLENHENVLVCAHTSSGKTVVAEYAIALGKKINRRVIYTSPIKALSNQKYRDFKKKFGDVGILTGDVSINQDAQCMIMTTEILQSSLYKNSEMLNNVEWVIFDEVHYINDNERGHVWEEILILLPQDIGIIMLSATVPNYLDLAQWVGKIKNTTIYVQNTLKRVVPLEHSIFVSGRTYLVKDKDNKVYEDNVKTAIKLIKASAQWEKNGNKQNQNKKKADKERINRILQFDKIRGTKSKISAIKITKMHYRIEESIDFLTKNQLTPAVIFVFSIKRIDEYAKILSSKELASPSEVAKIKAVFNNCIDSSLDKNDREIPQIKVMGLLLQSGIGVHHSGLLPILKEIVEILYSLGLIKILFATTSFSIGLNMPTKTVVFTDIYKYNDERKEILTSSEYLQMCGRAGRRGTDLFGNVLFLLGDKVNESDCEEIIKMLKGTGTEVESKFRLSYRTIISFLSRNIKEINDFFKESFMESLNIKAIPVIQKELKDLSKQLDEINKISCTNKEDDEYIQSYYSKFMRHCKLTNALLHQRGIFGQLTLGRIIRLYDEELKEVLFGVVIKYYTALNNELWCVIHSKKEKIKIEYENENELKKRKKKIKTKRYKETDKSGFLNDISYEYKEYRTSDIIDIYTEKISVKKSVIIDMEGYEYLTQIDLSNFLSRLEEITSNNTANSPLKVIDYKSKVTGDADCFRIIEEKNTLSKEIEESPCHKCPLFSLHFNQIIEISKIKEEIEKKERDLNPENMKHYNEFNNRIEILKRLEFIDSNNTLTLKGKAAREIATNDCVLVAELLLSGILEKLKSEEIVAFISAFATNKNEIEFETLKISDDFTRAVRDFENIYKRIVKVEREVDDFEENKYNRKITFSPSRALYRWMLGEHFYQILKETELEEGKLYNLIMRVFLFIEEISNFHEILGNTTLVKKYEEIKGKLMREIMSTRSLYLQDNIEI